MCTYQKNYEQYIKNGTEIEDTEIKNRFEIRMKNKRAYYAVVDLLNYQDAELTTFSIINHYIRFVDREDDILGSMSIDRIKLSDAREWAIRMQQKGFSYGTINNYKRSLKASYYIAIDDECVRKKLFDFPLIEVIDDNSKTKIQLVKNRSRNC